MGPVTRILRPASSLSLGKIVGNQLRFKDLLLEQQVRRKGANKIQWSSGSEKLVHVSQKKEYSHLWQWIIQTAIKEDFMYGANTWASPTSICFWVLLYLFSIYDQTFLSWAHSFLSYGSSIHLVIFYSLLFLFLSLWKILNSPFSAG